VPQARQQQTALGRQLGLVVEQRFELWVGNRHEYEVIDAGGGRASITVSPMAISRGCIAGPMWTTASVPASPSLTSPGTSRSVTTASPAPSSVTVAQAASE
jgi:hypothetical protein